MFEISMLKFEKLQSFVQKKILGVLGRNLKKKKKLLTYLKSALLKVSQKQKNFKFEIKIVLFVYFRAAIFEKLLSYLKSAPSNLWNCKVSFKTKELSTWDQKCFIFDLLKNTLLLGQNLKKLFSNLKLAPSNLWNCKVLFKTKKLRTKNDLFGYFYAKI